MNIELVSALATMLGSGCIGGGIGYALGHAKGENKSIKDEMMHLVAQDFKQFLKHHSMSVEVDKDATPDEVAAKVKSAVMKTRSQDETRHRAEG